MKTAIAFLFFIAFFPATAQKETFDIVTFSPPQGWTKQSGKDVTSYTTVDKAKGSWCQIGIYKSTRSKGNVQADFENEWKDLVLKSHVITNGPTKSDVQEDDGWQIIGAAAESTFEDQPMVIMHLVATGYDVTVSILAKTNDVTYMADIEKFNSSVELKKPAGSTAIISSTTNSGITGTWIKSASIHASYNDVAATGMAGYSKEQYTLNPDGSYRFYAKVFQSSINKIILVRESGSYQISGNNLTISPQTSVIESWSKKDGGDKYGSKLTSEVRAPEKVTYTFTRHFFEGIQQWNLVLQATAETSRDGRFSNNTTFTNAYYYSPESPNNLAVDLPQ